MNRRITRTIHTPGGLRVREDGGGRTIEGYSIVFGQPSVVLGYDGKREVREVIAPEAVSAEFLDGQDIKMTMFHDRQLILARSNKGSGTLSYEVDGRGVRFSFEAPATADGDKALELVRRGDLSGCSFAFSTYYGDEDYVTSETDREVGVTTFTVRRMLGVYDFTIAADPAYPSTTVQARELTEAIDASIPVDPGVGSDKSDNTVREQVSAMRRAATLYY